MNIPFEQAKSKIGNIGNTSITKIDYDIENNIFNVIELGNKN